MPAAMVVCAEAVAVDPRIQPITMLAIVALVAFVVGRLLQSATDSGALVPVAVLDPREIAETAFKAVMSTRHRAGSVFWSVYELVPDVMLARSLMRPARRPLNHE